MVVLLGEDGEGRARCWLGKDQADCGISGGVELSVIKEGQTSFKDGRPRVGVAHDVTMASRQRHNKARNRAHRCGVGHIYA